jgi:hypothetical protein
MFGSQVVWGDENHVDGCHGGYKGVDAFQYEQETCDKLDAYVENRRNAGFGFVDQIEGVRQLLARADSTLAAVAIADAIAAAGKPDEIAKAEELFVQGNEAKALGGGSICDVALDKYEEAWEKAVKSWCNSDGVPPARVATGAALPREYTLAQNYPNPFNASTVISYALPVDAAVRLEVYNIMGQKVRTLINGHQVAGYKTVTWNGTDQSGGMVSSGIYIYRLQAGPFRAGQKMIFVK